MSSRSTWAGRSGTAAPSRRSRRRSCRRRSTAACRRRWRLFGSPRRRSGGSRRSSRPRPSRPGRVSGSPSSASSGSVRSARRSRRRISMVATRSPFTTPSRGDRARRRSWCPRLLLAGRGGEPRRHRLRVAAAPGGRAGGRRWRGRPGGGARMRTYVDLSTTGATVAVEVAEALGGQWARRSRRTRQRGRRRRARAHARGDGSGDEAVFERVRPLLQLFGKNVFHVGSRPGQGQTAKLLNNLLSATALAITSEAVTFGITAGLDPATLLEVFNAGTGRNTATATKFPDHVLTQRFASEFRLELMAKDLELCLGEVRAKRVSDAGGRARAAALDAGGRGGRRRRRPHGDHQVLRAPVGGRGRCVEGGAG